LAFPMVGIRKARFRQSNELLVFRVDAQHSILPITFSKGERTTGAYLF
jgi:hypothetical protein